MTVSSYPSNTRKAPGPKRARLAIGPRPHADLGDWLAAWVRGLDALEFLERSRELAAETVTASVRPLTNHDPQPTMPGRETDADSDSRPAVR
jgi:hypothetical protein